MNGPAQVANCLRNRDFYRLVQIDIGSTFLISLPLAVSGSTLAAGSILGVEMTYVLSFLESSCNPLSFSASLLALSNACALPSSLCLVTSS